MSTLPLEKNLEDLYGQQAPHLSSNARKALAQYLPWITLFFGIISLWSAYNIWHWAHIADTLVNYANSISAIYGGQPIATNRLTFSIWLGISALAIEGLLYVIAFPSLQSRKKAGWNLLYYALLVNVVYGLVIMFTNYGAAGDLIGRLIGSAIGFYFLFEIRSLYAPPAPAKAKPAKPAKPAKRKAAKKKA